LLFRASRFANFFEVRRVCKAAVIKEIRCGSPAVSTNFSGRRLDNVFSERRWRSLKYECVYLNAFETGSEAPAGIGRWVIFYNQIRPHATLGGKTPDSWYYGGRLKAA
jgi:transposase InsO family protein